MKQRRWKADVFNPKCISPGRWFVRSHTVNRNYLGKQGPLWRTADSSIFGEPLDRMSTGVPFRASKVGLHLEMQTERDMHEIASCSSLTWAPISLTAERNAASVISQKSLYCCISDRNQVYSNCFCQSGLLPKEPDRRMRFLDH